MIIPFRRDIAPCSYLFSFWSVIVIIYLKYFLTPTCLSLCLHCLWVGRELSSPLTPALFSLTTVRPIYHNSFCHSYFHLNFWKHFVYSLSALLVSSQPITHLVSSFFVPFISFDVYSFSFLPFLLVFLSLTRKPMLFHSYISLIFHTGFLMLCFNHIRNHCNCKHNIKEN